MTAITSHIPIPTAADAAPVVGVRGLTKLIDQRTVLHDVSFTVRPRDYVAVVGRNGGGKTTLLRILAALTPPTSGQVQIFGRSVASAPVELRRRIGLIDHQSMLYRDLTAAENLEFYAGLYGLDDPAARSQAMLARFGLGARANDLVKSFSRGMVQRLSIGRALLHEPELLLADEPFAGLDAPSCEFVERCFNHLVADGKTIILVNHDIEQTLRIVDRMIVLRGGTVVLDQPTRRLYLNDVLEEVSAT